MPCTYVYVHGIPPVRHRFGYETEAEVATITQVLLTAQIRGNSQVGT